MRLVPFSSRIRRSDEPGMGPMRSDLDRIFDRMLRSPWPEDLPPSASGWAPSVDISESESEIVLRFEVPGIKPDDIDITVSGDRLIISGEKSEQREQKDEHYYHCERRFGSFERSIDLPSTADLEKVSADHANGVLTIHVPKLEAAKPKRVQIMSSGGDEQKRKSVSVSDAQGSKHAGKPPS